MFGQVRADKDSRDKNQNKKLALQFVLFLQIYVKSPLFLFKSAQSQFIFHFLYLACRLLMKQIVLLIATVKVSIDVLVHLFISGHSLEDLEECFLRKNIQQTCQFSL